MGSNLEESRAISLRKRIARNLELEPQLRTGQIVTGDNVGITRP